ncbi:MAG: family 16 glycoside hydrolase [Candidatus Thermoplasmatota archaeon]
MRNLFALAAVLMFLLAGCAATPAASSSDAPQPLANSLCAPAAGAAFTESFDGTFSGWVSVGGTWAVAANSSARSGGHLLRGTGAGAVSDDVACPHGSFTDFELEVDLRIVAPAEDAAGAGVVIHFHNATNHQIVRYSVREAGWHIFTWTDAEPRSKKSEANVEGPSPQHVAGEWIHLKVVSKQALITAFDGATKILEYQLPPGHSRSGAVGAFLRDVTTADFDNLTVKLL